MHFTKIQNTDVTKYRYSASLVTVDVSPFLVAYRAHTLSPIESGQRVAPALNL